MKRFLAILALFFALPIFAATVTFPLTNFNLTVPTNTIQLFQYDGPYTTTSAVITGNPIRINPSNGYAQTNLAGGGYELKLVGVNFANRYIFYVPDTTNTYTVMELRTNAAVIPTAPPFVTQIRAGSNVVVTPATGKGVVTVSMSVGAGISNIVESLEVTGTLKVPPILPTTTERIYPLGHIDGDSTLYRSTAFSFDDTTAYFDAPSNVLTGPIYMAAGYVNGEQIASLKDATNAASGKQNASANLDGWSDIAATNTPLKGTITITDDINSLSYMTLGLGSLTLPHVKFSDTAPTKPQGIAFTWDGKRGVPGDTNSAARMFFSPDWGNLPGNGWLLVSAPNIRLEPGWNQYDAADNTNRGTLTLHNEDGIGPVLINYQALPTNAAGTGPARYSQLAQPNVAGMGHPLWFSVHQSDANGTNYISYPSITAHGAPLGENPLLFSDVNGEQVGLGELWFYSAGPGPSVADPYANDHPGVVVAKMHTNSFEFIGDIVAGGGITLGGVHYDAMPTGGTNNFGTNEVIAAGARFGGSGAGSIIITNEAGGTATIDAGSTVGNVTVHLDAIEGQTNNAVLIAGSNVTVETNSAGGVTTYTISAEAASGTDYSYEATVTNTAEVSSATFATFSVLDTNCVVYVDGTFVGAGATNRYVKSVQAILRRQSGANVFEVVTNTAGEVTTVINNNTFQNISVTNITVTNVTAQTVTTVTNVFNVARGATVIATNVFYLQSRPQVVAWSGPTNQIDFSLGQAFTFTAVTPISITNITGLTNGYMSSALLWVTNGASSNITVSLPTGWKIGPSDPTVCTNGDILQVWPSEAGGMKTIATKSYH